MAKQTAAPAVPEPSVDELLDRGKARATSPGTTLAEIDNLQALYRDVATATDDDAKSIKREIKRKFRRLTHAEQHPDCKDVEITVRRHPTGSMYTINAKPYFGRQVVHECVARQLAYMMAQAEDVERNRMKEQGRVIDLDNPVAERVRQIQEA